MKERTAIYFTLLRTIGVGSKIFRPVPTLHQIHTIVIIALWEIVPSPDLHCSHIVLTVLWEIVPSQCIIFYSSQNDVGGKQNFSPSPIPHKIHTTEIVHVVGLWEIVPLPDLACPDTYSNLWEEMYLRLISHVLSWCSVQVDVQWTALMVPWRSRWWWWLSLFFSVLSLHRLL